MESLGVIEGWSLTTNPHMLGRKCITLYFETPDDSQMRQAIEKLARLEEVATIHSFHGGSLLVILEYPKEVLPEEQVALAEAACGTKCTMFWERRYSPFEIALSPTDWSILRALRNDPRRKLSEIAGEVGISSRTLNRRMDRLVEGDAFFLEPVVNYQKIGRLSFTLLVSYATIEGKKAVDDLISRKLGSLCEVRDTRSNSSHSTFSLFSDNLTEAKKVHGWVKSLEGVTDVRMGIHEGRILSTSWMNDRLEAMGPVSRPMMSMPKRKNHPPPRPYLIPPRTLKDVKSRNVYWSGSVVEGRRVKVVLDSAICMGTGSCVEVAPKVFKLDRQSKKSILDPTPLRILKDRTMNLEDIFLAAQSCPYRVIKLEDADTGEPLFP